MLSRSNGRLFAACTALVCSAPWAIAFAADTRSPPDFSGVYQVRRGYGYSAPSPPTLDKQPIPLKDWAVKELKFYEDTEAKGTPIPRAEQLNWPKNFVHASKGTFNFQLVQNADQMSWFFEEDMQYFFVPLNAEHPDNLKPSFLADAVGHWEGDTLVIDMIGFNGRTPLGSYPITSQAHLTMRLRQTDNGKSIENIVHIDDPGAYTRPWDSIIIYDRTAPGTRVYESVYAENQRDVPDMKLMMRFEPPK